jgi:hypothetical protein
MYPLRYLMDDDKLMKDIDFSQFEEEFKLNSAPIIKKGANESTDTDGASLGVSNGTGTLRYLSV